MKNKELQFKSFAEATAFINKWLTLNRKYWFQNIDNAFFGLEYKARAIAEYWLLNGKHEPDYNNYVIFSLQKYWDEYVDVIKKQGGKDESNT